MTIINNSKLFLVQTDTALHPKFYVSADNLIEAALKAGKIVEAVNEMKSVLSIREEGTVLLDVEIP